MWFYIGLPVTLTGLVVYTMVLVNWATAPLNEPVSRGMYRYSRHPMYVTFIVFLLGISIATASWVFLLFSILFGIGCAAFVDVEERSCLQQYGKSYRKYMDRTPRWIGMPKS
jgi:protein-S-isoprenylcysteine O-methyltransferase Ste14